MATILTLTCDLLRQRGVVIGELPMEAAFDADRLVRDAMSRALNTAAQAIEAGQSADDLRAAAAEIATAT